MAEPAVYTALRLEAITGISAELWVGLQANYDLALERRDPPPVPASKGA